MPDQALISFAGAPLLNPKGFQCTMGHGVEPAAFVVRALPQQFNVQERAVGALTISWGGTTMTFSECLVNHVDRRAGAGHHWTYVFLDRRWKWRYGSFSGAFNIPGDPSVGRSHILSPNRTPQAIAEELLTAMGETRFDVSDMPNDARPSFEWDNVNPAVALDRLCRHMRMRIVLGDDDVVRIYPLGTGAPLPGGHFEDFGEDVVRRKPDATKVTFQPTMFESELEIEAVGQDISGEIVPIEETDWYKRDEPNPWPYLWPGLDWSFSYLSSVGTAPRWGFRYYRVKGQRGGGVGVPGAQSTVSDVSQYYLLPHRIGAPGFGKSVAPGSPLEPHVVGDFWGMENDYRNVRTDQTNFSQHYSGGFIIDSERNYIIFAYPLLWIDRPGTWHDWNQEFNRTPGTGRALPARVYLQTAYHVRTEPGGPFERYSVIAGNVGPAYDTENEIVRFSHRRLLVQHGQPSNKTELDEEADKVLSLAGGEHAARTARERRWLGMVPLSCDGLTRQVAWRAGICSPGGRPETIASVNAEHDVWERPYEEMRLISEARESLYEKDVV